MGHFLAEFMWALHPGALGTTQPAILPIPFQSLAPLAAL
jgi:hypothetical protein